MARIKDLTGQILGHLEVLAITDERKHGKVVWLCKCECGNLKKVDSGNLQNGSTVSCGCYSKNILNKSRIKHGMNKSRIYNIYICMKERCYNQNAKSYKEYGKRGIRVCDEWLGEDGFKNFYEWSIKNGYADNLSIDRIDVNVGYEPTNCRWATSVMQNNNTRRNNYITLDGEIHTMAEWCRIKNVSRSAIVERIKKGWDVEEAFSVPIRPRKNIKLCHDMDGLVRKELEGE